MIETYLPVLSHRSGAPPGRRGAGNCQEFNLNYLAELLAATFLLLVAVPAAVDIDNINTADVRQRANAWEVGSDDWFLLGRAVNIGAAI